MCHAINHSRETKTDFGVLTYNLVFSQVLTRKCFLKDITYFYSLLYSCIIHFSILQWPAGDQKEENDIEEDEEKQGVENGAKRDISNFGYLDNFNYWNYDLVEN